MGRKRPKLFEEFGPGNFMPVNRDGCIIGCAFILVAVAMVLLGEFLTYTLESPWPSRIAWALFIMLLIGFLRFASRHSGED